MSHTSPYTYTRNYKAFAWNQGVDPSQNTDADPTLLDNVGPSGSGKYWMPDAFCGATPTPVSGNITAIVSASQFNSIYPYRNAFYTFNAFVAAANQYTTFAPTSHTTEVRKRTVAAALANFHHETGGLWHIKEQVVGDYCGTWSTTTPDCVVSCPPAAQYYGRGPIQLSWNTNYCNASKSIFGNLTLLTNPMMVQTDAAVAWKTALWYWTTQIGPVYEVGPPAVNSQLAAWPHHTAQQAITTTDASGNYGFGGTIRAINGAIECGGGGGGAITNRINQFNNAKSILGYTGGAFGRDDC